MTQITSSEFHVIFAMSKTIMFDVDYYTLGSNNKPYYSTAAEEFNKPKTGYNRCGQAQESLLKKYPAAYNFYKKWDSEHTKELTDEKYNELIQDLEKLFLKEDLSIFLCII